MILAGRSCILFHVLHRLLPFRSRDCLLLILLLAVSGGGGFFQRAVLDASFSRFPGLSFSGTVYFCTYLPSRFNDGIIFSLGLSRVILQLCFLDI